MLRLLTLLAALLFAVPAQAAPISATPSPSAKNVSSISGASFPVVWTVAYGPAGANTMRSSQVIIRLSNGNGPIIATLTRPLANVTTTGGSSVTMRENVTLSRDYIQRAIQQGVPLVYQRTFVDTSNQTVTNEIQINIASAATADFSLSSMDLSFENSAATMVVDQNASLTAVARLHTTGSGRIQAAWQVREANTGMFRTLRTVTSSALSGMPITLRSPLLPTAQAGNQYEVRLHMTNPEAGFEEPVIVYSVSAGERGALMPFTRLPGEVTVTSPADFSPLSDKTEISWEAASGAKAYRIEVLPSTGGQTPLASQLVKADSTSAKLSALELSKLAPEGRYRIRVLAEQ